MGLSEADFRTMQDEVDSTRDALERAQEDLCATKDELSRSQGALQAMTVLRHEFERSLMEAQAEII